MKTSDLERELGLSKHTIRYYEKEGFITPQRDDNGYRNYSDEDLQVLKLIKFLRGLNISIDDVKAIVNGHLDSHECLRVNQIHLDHQIENMKEIKKTIDNYHDKDLPLIPALQDIEETSHHWKLGIQKTTNTVSLGRKLTKAWAKRQIIYEVLGSLFLTGTVMIWLRLVIEQSWIWWTLFALMFITLTIVSTGYAKILITSLMQRKKL